MTLLAIDSAVLEQLSRFLAETADPACSNYGEQCEWAEALKDTANLAPPLFDWHAFSRRNRRRSTSPDGFNHPLDAWSLSDWMTATMGELGEAANVLKKLNRERDGLGGNSLPIEELRRGFAHELADTFIYLDLLAQAAGIDLPLAVEEKFAITSRKRGYVEPEDVAS